MPLSNEVTRSRPIFKRPPQGGRSRSPAMTQTSQPQKPVLSPATFPDAVLRLAAATDDELREWDRALAAELKAHYDQEHEAA